MYRADVELISRYYAIVSATKTIIFNLDDVNSLEYRSNKYYHRE